MDSSRTKDLAAGVMNCEMDFVQLLESIQSQGVLTATITPTIQEPNAEQSNTGQVFNFEEGLVSVEDLLPLLQHLMESAGEKADFIALDDLSPDIQELWQAYKSGPNVEQTNPGQVFNFEEGLVSVEDLLPLLQHLMESAGEKADFIALDDLSPDIQELWQAYKSGPNVEQTNPGQVFNFEEGLVSVENLLPLLQHLMESAGEKADFIAFDDLPPDMPKLWQVYKSGANAEQTNSGQVFNFEEGLVSVEDLLPLLQHLMESTGEKANRMASDDDLPPDMQKLWQTYKLIEQALNTSKQPGIDKIKLSQDMLQLFADLSRATGEAPDNEKSQLLKNYSVKVLSSDSLTRQAKRTTYPDQRAGALLTNTDLKQTIQKPYNESRMSQMLQELILPSKTQLQNNHTIMTSSTDVQRKINLNDQSSALLTRIMNDTQTASVPKHETGSKTQIDTTPSFLINNDLLSAAKSVDGKAITLTKTGDNNVFMQLAEAIRGQVGKDGQGQTYVRLQLQPEHLGEVVIKISYRDGNIATHFQTASQHAKYMIENAVHQLRETLNSFNLNLQNVSVSVGGENNRRGQNWNQSRQHKKQLDASSGESIAIGENVLGQSADKHRLSGALDKLNYFV